MATHIIGLNAYHGDASACLLKDGVLVAAVEEERFRRTKHWAGFPSEAISYCLGEAGIGMSDVAAVAMNQDSRAHLWKKIAFTVAQRPGLSLLLDRIRNKRQRAGIDAELKRAFPEQTFTGRIVPVEHHLAHLASAFHVSPFDAAMAVSVDSFGDFASSAWGIADGTEISVAGRVYFPHSLGIFYSALTQFLGFPHYGDEYKVMGLAPYGRPTYLDALRKVVQLQENGGYRLNVEYFRHVHERIEYEWANGPPDVIDLFSPVLVDMLGPRRRENDPIDQRHRDIASSVQAMYEEAFFHLLNAVYIEDTNQNLVLAGGCAMNSVANGKICRNSPYKNTYIQAAAGDAGGAVGAAFVAWHQGETKNLPRFIMDHAYWGPQFSNVVIGEVLKKRQAELEPQGCAVEFIEDESVLCRRTAGKIADGKVVGWFQGRMEWGPRALGNRSIVCDPRRADMKVILNAKIKRREPFRPFAPSILRHAVHDWFEEDEDVPFMTKVFRVRQEKRSQIPAVTHVDGSGRLQTVHQKTNPRYHSLIEFFATLTGVPMLLNTSFNENEPIVCHPEEALDCFLRTRMDVLVMEDWLLSRDGG